MKLKDSVAESDARINKVEESVNAQNNDVSNLGSRVEKVENTVNSVDLNAMAAECQSRMQKLSNVILYELKEDLTVNDRDLIIQCLSLIQGINTNGITVRRLPSKLASHPKPLKIMLNSPMDVSLVFQNSNVLPAGVKIIRDKTRLELDSFRQLKQQAEEHNQLHPEAPKKVVYINNTPTLVNDKKSGQSTSQSKNEEGPQPQNSL